MSNTEVRFLHDTSKVTKDMEMALCIDGTDYAGRDIDVVIRNIMERIQRKYSIDIPKDANELYSVSNINSEVHSFVESMEYLYLNISGLSHYFRYSGSVPVSLSKINYLGITQDSLNSVLKLLQQEGKQNTLDAPLEQIKYNIPKIPMSLEKKLFMLLYVTYQLKIYELTAIIAEILYLGGI